MAVTETLIPEGGGGIGAPPSARRAVSMAVTETPIPEGGGGIGAPPSARRAVSTAVTETPIPEGGGGIGAPPSAQIEIVEVGTVFRALTCVLTVERLEATIVSSSALPAITKNFAACFMRNTSCDVFRKKRAVRSGFR
jgi:hypothetical protein